MALAEEHGNLVVNGIMAARYNLGEGGVLALAVIWSRGDSGGPRSMMATCEELLGCHACMRSNGQPTAAAAEHHSSPAMETSAAAAGGAHLIYVSSDDEEDETRVLLAESYSAEEIQIQQAILLSLDPSSDADAAHSSASSSRPSGAASTSDEPSSLPDRKGKRKRKLSSEEDGPSESTRKKRRKRGRFKCSICMEKVQVSEQFIVSFCAHAFCNSCIGRYVAAKISENVAVIGCPDPGCEEGFVEMDTCRDIIPPELFDRWSVSLCELALGEKKYYCPFKDCSALLINDNDGAEKKIRETECPHCHRMFCARCRVPWHDGIKCKEFRKLGDDEKGEEDLMFKKLAGKKKWQRCPNYKMQQAAMAASAALKMAALCVLVLCSIGTSQAMMAHASSTAKQDAAAGAVLRELVRNVVAEELGLGGGGDACPAACQNCLILCAIKCVLKPTPVACYADCITKDGCFKAGEVAES
uniref:RBR-type E3 ubiquitin transferase n=1 Tax=Oryza meridionalis TaxID=40149 RepID=A0A0E0ESA3_9ORYZ